MDETRIDIPGCVPDTEEVPRVLEGDLSLSPITELQDCAPQCWLCLNCTGQLETYECSFCKKHPGCILHSECFSTYTTGYNLRRYMGKCLNCNKGQIIIPPSNTVSVYNNENRNYSTLKNIYRFFIIVGLPSLALYIIISSS